MLFDYLKQQQISANRQTTIVWGDLARPACLDSALHHYVLIIRIVLLCVGWAPFSLAAYDFFFLGGSNSDPPAFAVFSYENTHALK